MPGIFISRGMTLSVPVGGMVVGTGAEEFVIKSLTLQIRFDVCPTWIELSLNHTARSIDAKNHRDKIWAAGNEEAKAPALEREFEHSMQAMMAAAIAIDAFYAVLAQHVYLPPSVLANWRTKRTSRYAQVTEVIRRAFKLKPSGTAGLRQNLKEIYRTRDLAVHPSGKIEIPVHHPELDLGVEWRFAYFRSSNAVLVNETATWIIWELCKKGAPQNSDIQDYISKLSERLDQIFPNGHPFDTQTTNNKAAS